MHHRARHLLLVLALPKAYLFILLSELIAVSGLIAKLPLSILLYVSDILHAFSLPLHAQRRVEHALFVLHELVKLLPVRILLHLIEDLLKLQRLLCLLDPFSLLNDVRRPLVPLLQPPILDVDPVLICKLKLVPAIFLLDDGLVVAVREHLHTAIEPLTWHVLRLLLRVLLWHVAPLCQWLPC